MTAVARRTKSFTIWLDPEDYEAIKNEAGKLALPPATLARSVLIRHLRACQYPNNCEPRER